MRFADYLPFIGDAKTYRKSNFKRDMIAALTVTVIALPQSMAYAIIAGVDPKYGLYAAILPVIISSLFGSSRFLIAGPTNAVSMVVYSTIASVMIGGMVISELPDADKMAAVFLLAFMTGVIQVIMGLGKLGNLINFVSHSVVIGFTAGAGFLIGFNQLKNLLGLNIKTYPHFTDMAAATFKGLGGINPYAFGIGLFAMLFIIFAKRISKRIPGMFLAIVSSGLIVAVFGLEDKVKTIGQISSSLPPLSTFSLSMDSIHALMMPAIALSILAIVEALSIAKSLANSSGDKIDGNQELIAQGLANIGAAFTSGIPGTGSFTRSAVNYKSGAATRFSGVMSGLFVLVTLLIFAPLARFIPTPSLAGALIVIAYSMVDKKGIAFAWRATKSDRVVLFVTIFSTVFLELESAIYIGVLLSMALYLNRASKPNVFEVIPREGDHRLVPLEESDVIPCPQVSIKQIEGSLFFASTSALENDLYNDQTTKVVILRMRNADMLDATGAHALERFIVSCHEKGIMVIFSGVRAGVLRVFERTGVINEIDRTNIVENTTDAIALALKKYVDRKECKNCKIRIYREC